MTDPTPKSGKSVAPLSETVRLFEILGYGSNNEEESQRMVKNIMEVTGCGQDTAIVTLHDCNDETEAIQRLLDSTSSATQEGWVTKKKSNKKKSVLEPIEVASPDPPKAYVTDGHTGDSGFEFRRGNKSYDRNNRDNWSGGRRERRVGREESWDGDENAEPNKPEGSPRYDEDKSQRNGYYNNRNSRRYGQENRRDEELDWGQDEDRSYQSYKRKERYSRPRRPQRDEDDLHTREWTQRDKPRTFRYKNDSSGRKFENRGDKDPNLQYPVNKSSKSPSAIEDFGDDASDKIDWENPELKRTDWGADEEVKDSAGYRNSDDEYDEDRRIEAILTEGLEICNSNYDQELPSDVQTEDNPASSTAAPPSDSTLSLPPQTKNHGITYPILSPQTTSLPTPSASIPESRPHSHHQAMGDMFSRVDKMSLKRKVRSKIPQAPVELPKRAIESLDMLVQFGNIDNLPPDQKEPEVNSLLPDSQSSTEPTNPAPNATFQETNKSPSIDDDTNKTETAAPPSISPPPKSPSPAPRSPVPTETQPSISDTSPLSTALPTHPAPAVTQQHTQYPQHINRPNERKYSDNKMHHHGGLSGNPGTAKMQQHSQMAPPMNAAEQPTGMPYLMTGPMGVANHTAPNTLPVSNISNMPRGSNKNYGPMIYNAQGVAPQFSMMPNFYVDQEMMRMMTSQANNQVPNMMKDQSSNPGFPNNDSKFHEPTSPGNPPSGIPAYVNFPFHGYLPNFFPNFFPMMPAKGNPVTPTAAQTAFQTQPQIPPNLSAMPEPHTDYKANYPSVQQKPGIPQPNDIQNMYKAFDPKSPYPFNFGYPMPPYVTPQIVPQAMSQQQQPQYSGINPNVLHQQTIDTQRGQKW